MNDLTTRLGERFLKMADEIIKNEGKMTKEAKDLIKTAKRLVKKIEDDKKLQEKYDALPIPGTDDWVEVGEVGVDAGMVSIGDPCYILALPHSNKEEDAKSERGISEFSDMYEPKELPKSLGQSWGEFCDKMDDAGSWPYGSEEYNNFLKKQIKKGHQSGQRAVQFNYEAGHPGLGVCVGSGYGDGSYPVLVKRNKEGRITEVKVVFISAEDFEE